MRRVGFVVVVVSIFAFGSLPSGAGQKPGNHTPVPLVVTMKACGGPLVPEICGDDIEQDAQGNTIYTDGQQGVRATLDQYGSLIINFQTAGPKIRGLVYNYVGSTSAPPGGGFNHYLSTTGGALQDMQYPDGIMNVWGCLLYTDDSGQPRYGHSFSRDCGSGLGSVGVPLVVTRISGTIWKVEPWSSPTASPTARVFSAMTKGRPQIHDFGDISLPFKMTLTAKP